MQVHMEKLEKDILTHAHIPELLPIQFLFDEKNAAYTLVYQPTTAYKSVESLLSMGFFERKHLLVLLKDILHVQKTVEKFMLRQRQIVFKMTHVFFDPDVSSFKFCYAPSQTLEAEDALLDFTRSVLIESDLNLNDFDMGLLKKAHFDLNTLVTCLQTASTAQVAPADEKNGFIDRLLNKFNKTSPAPEKKPVYQTATATVFMPLNGCLIDKKDRRIMHTLHFEINSIGRGTHCNICLNDPEISKEHAVIGKLGNAYYIKDLGSKNGTFVDGEKIENSFTLASGNVLKLGTKEFVFIL